MSFKTPPPRFMNNTLDAGAAGPTLNMLNSFGQFSEEPDTTYRNKQNLNILKESISKLSTDFQQDRMFIQSMIKNSNRKNQYFSMSRSPFIKSTDGLNMDEDTLPKIHPGGHARNANIKSPVMESIRMSRQNKSKQFMSMQKYRDNDSPGSDGDSNSDRSDISKATNMRKSVYGKRNNPKNMSMNRGTFFVHKKDNSAKPVERHENIIRASTILNASMMFGKKRNSKVAKNKQSIIVDKYTEITNEQDAFRNSRRKSKTFIEKDQFKNKLASAQQSKRSKILNPCMESKESPEFREMDEMNANLLLSQKSINIRQGREII